MHHTMRTYNASLARLNAREQKFVSQYLTHGNGTKAARVAGYSPKSARVIASQNLTKLNIRRAVEAGLHAISVRCAIDAEKVMRELAAIAFSNFLHYEVAADGTLGLAAGAPAEAMLALARTKHKHWVKQDGTVATESEFTFCNKLKALQLLGKNLKLFTERLEVENVQDALYKDVSSG